MECCYCCLGTKAVSEFVPEFELKLHTLQNTAVYASFAISYIYLIKKAINGTAQLPPLFIECSSGMIECRGNYQPHRYVIWASFKQL